MNNFITENFYVNFIINVNNVRIVDDNIIDYINKIRIPPAWKNVKIFLSKKSNKLALGTDAGRIQTIYNKLFYFKK